MAGNGSKCSDDHNYVAIIITIAPLWASLTMLIIFLLCCFHKSLRTIKVYDNCTKQTAQYSYHVELRTGDTSASFNRRRTNLTIDMFDDGQVSMARIVIPGHVIFGRKDTPVAAIEDDKLPELRVTRFWLFRANKLRKVATIRLTHSCTEADAKIMVYGVEIRTNDRGKMFFPVMGYISAYGSTSKPNACFDVDTVGSISNMGASKVESLIFSADLNLVDYTILTHLFLALTMHLTSLEIFEKSFEQLTACVYKGLLVGLLSFLISLLVGCLLRYYIKTNYYSKVGMGSWCWIYITTLLVIFSISTGDWIATAIISYQQLCSNDHSKWLISITMSIVIGSLFSLALWLANWIYQVMNPTIVDQYTVPEDVTGAVQAKKSLRHYANSSDPTAKNQSYNNQYPYHHHQPIPLPNHQPHPWAMGYGGPVAHVAHPIIHQTPPPYYGGPPLVLTPSQASYKTLQTAYQPTGYDTPPTAMSQSPQTNLATTTTATTATTTTADTTNQASNEHGVSLHGIKPTRRIGSSESTGSHYYNQLMKKKGEVKSISQYGELHKQKKTTSKGTK